jgi:hypothetical protein
MPRLHFDLGIWLVCTAGLLVLSSIGLLVDPRPRPDFWTYVAFAVGACALAGLVVQNGVVKKGYRLMKRRPPDQAEDFEDKP